MTIKDVAKHIGVGTMTVSRVLNNSGYVATAMREKVEAAVAELGYVPNHLARGLRSRRSGTLALLITDITNPFFTTVARGAEDAASDAGSLVLLCNTDENEQEEVRYMRMLVEKQVDGVVLVPARAGREVIEMAKKNGIEVVVVDRAAPGSNLDVVRCDAFDGARLLANHLLELGHRTFAILAGPKGVSTSDDRVKGFTDTLDKAGLGENVIVHHGDFTLDSGATMAKQVFESPNRPSAFFAVNNFIAFGAIAQARRSGVRIPEDLALVGFDDLPQAMVTVPFLTVADQPAYEMGYVAVKRLMSRISPGERKPYEETILPVNLIVRRSSGEPRNS